MNHQRRETGVRITDRRPVDDNYAVITVVGGNLYRRSPCDGCPWRKDQTGAFPPGAFLESARVAHDASDHMFGCHESDPNVPLTCAGFLLRGSEHNVAYRVAVARGRIDPRQINDGGYELYGSYREMAVGNGCSPSDPALRDCRP